MSPSLSVTAPSAWSAKAPSTSEAVLVEISTSSSAAALAAGRSLAWRNISTAAASSGGRRMRCVVSNSARRIPVAAASTSPRAERKQRQTGHRFLRRPRWPAHRPPLPPRTNRRVGAARPLGRARARARDAEGRSVDGMRPRPPFSASRQSPAACSSCDRCTRHCPRKGTSSGCSSHHAYNTSVHSAARRRSNICMHSKMTAQYATPDAIGPTSPVDTATITSSKRAVAAANSPNAIRACPSPTPANAPRSASPNAAAISAALMASSRAALASPERSAPSTRRNHHVAPSAALQVVTDDCFGPTPPSAGLRHLPAHHQAERQPERTSSCVGTVPGVDMTAMRRFPRRRAAVVVTDQKRRNRQLLQLGRVKGLVRHLDQLVIHRMPRSQRRRDFEPSGSYRPCAAGGRRDTLSLRRVPYPALRTMSTGSTWSAADVGGCAS